MDSDADDDLAVFYVFGAVPSISRHVDGWTVRYVADDLKQVQQLGLLQAHQAALEYLVRVLGLGRPLPTPELLVVWAHRNASKGKAAGAAGGHSFIANCIVGPAGGDDMNNALSLLVIAHEQFHQLVALSGNALSPLPLWASESLAQYYAVKAGKRTFQVQRSASSRATCSIRRDPSRRDCSNGNGELPPATSLHIRCSMRRAPPSGPPLTTCFWRLEAQAGWTPSCQNWCVQALTRGVESAPSS